MGIIQCAEYCKFQKDGYCSLEKYSTVNTENSNCPYFISLDNRDGLSQTSDADYF